MAGCNACPVPYLDRNGNLIVKYRYDAWGNHKVLDASGNVITSASHIGNINPFRYRGYFYDIETGLYYLKTRYYDPVIGRFLNMDSIDYADPETINGLNLYAYCNNNPVMNVDPTGEFLSSLLIAIAVGVVVGGVVGGVTAKANGDSFLSGFLSGALVGGVLGGALILGGATMLAIAGKAVSGFIVASTFAAKTALLATTVIGTTIVSTGAGMASYAIKESINGREIDYSEMIRQGIMTGFKGGVAYFAGMALASTGSFDFLLKGVNWSLSKKVQFAIIRGITSFVLQFPWKIGLK